MKLLKFIILLSIFLFNCAEEKLNYTVEEIDGVRFVHNLGPKYSDNPIVELEFVQKIGDLTGEDENYLLYRPTQVTRDNLGNIYILDSGNFRIQIYNNDGKFINTIGKKGQGPGEFNNLSRMGIYDNDKFFVADRGNNKILTFDLGGKYKSEVRVDQLAIFSMVLNSGETITQSSSDIKISDDENERNVLLSKLDDKGKLNKKFGYVKKNNGILELNSLNIVYMTHDNDDNIYVNYWYDNGFDKFDSNGNLLLKFDRKTDQVRGDYLIGGGRGSFGFSRGIGIDYKNRIWAVMKKRQLQEGEDFFDHIQASDVYDFEIYSPDGVFLQKISPNYSVTQVSIVDDRVFVSSFKDMSVSEYKIVEK